MAILWCITWEFINFIGNGCKNHTCQTKSTFCFRITYLENKISQKIKKLFCAKFCALKLRLYTFYTQISFQLKLFEIRDLFHIFEVIFHILWKLNFTFDRINQVWKNCFFLKVQSKNYFVHLHSWISCISALQPAVAGSGSNPTSFFHMLQTFISFTEVKQTVPKPILIANGHSYWCNL